MLARSGVEGSGGSGVAAGGFGGIFAGAEIGDALP